MLYRRMHRIVAKRNVLSADLLVTTLTLKQSNGQIGHLSARTFHKDCRLPEATTVYGYTAPPPRSMASTRARLTLSYAVVLTGTLIVFSLALAWGRRNRAHEDLANEAARTADQIMN